jgi:hypothetical protein
MMAMKKDQKKTKPKAKLTLAKESVRKLSGPVLSDVVGGGNSLRCATITFPKCCVTA